MEEKKNNKRGEEKKRRIKRGEFFLNLNERWASEKEKKIPSQCLVWLRLNGLGSSQNNQNNFIHNWWVLVHLGLLS